MNEIERWNGCPTTLQETLAQYLIEVFKKIDKTLTDTIKFIAVAFSEDIVCVFKNVDNSSRLITNQTREVLYATPETTSFELFNSFKQGNRSELPVLA